MKQNCYILGGNFSNFFALSSYFYEKTEIFDFGNYSGAQLKSPILLIQIFSQKYITHQENLENLHPKMMQFCFFCYVL